jgi:hypothetical protein
LGLEINNIIVTGKHKFSLEKCNWPAYF